MRGLMALAVPVALLAASYGYLAWYHRRFDLWHVKIHESGRYTLAQTVFYFDHALREVPVNVAYVLALSWSFRMLAPDSLQIALARFSPAATVGLVAYSLFLMAGSVRRVGLRESWLDLAQYRERDSVLGFGSHWQMHFNSTVALVLIFLLPGTAARAPEYRWLGGLAVALVGVSLFFRVGRRSLRERRWLLHGGREVLTFVPLVGLPVALVLLPGIEWGELRIGGVFLTITIAIALLGGYYLAVLSRSSLGEVAEVELPAGYFLAAHFFEHTLDLPFMALLFVALAG